MLKPHVIFLMLLWGVSSNAQVREITGLVTYNNERQSGANVKDLSTNTQTFSDDRGAFSIKAKKGDTLISFKVNYILRGLKPKGTNENIKKSVFCTIEALFEKCKKNDMYHLV
jgi:hypothetical protein